MARSFCCIVLAVVICAMQAQAIQAEGRFIASTGRRGGAGPHPPALDRAAGEHAGDGDENGENGRYREVGQRIVKKLGVGALMGIVPVYGLGLYPGIRPLRGSCKVEDGLGSGIIFEFHGSVRLSGSSGDWRKSGLIPMIDLSFHWPVVRQGSWPISSSQEPKSINFQHFVGM